jgi:hypothetical protein
MSDERHDPGTLVNIACEIVSQRLGHVVRLRAGKVLSTWGSIVIRCHLIDSPTDAPPTVIIKKIREDQFAYDPDSPGTQIRGCSTLVRVGSGMRLLKGCQDE